MAVIKSGHYGYLKLTIIDVVRGARFKFSSMVKTFDAQVDMVRMSVSKHILASHPARALGAHMLQ
jgi:hypothetical protein